MDRRRIAVIGATSAIAQHCARLWVSSAPADLVLVGRDRERLEVVAADLTVRSPASTASVLTAGFVEPAEIGAAVSAVLAEGVPDLVLIAHGALTSQDQSQADLSVCRDTLAINGVSPALFAEAFVEAMLGAGRGTIVLIGSVAGDRGRKSNYVYGAAKGLVDRYAQGLNHRLAGSGVQVVLVKPGPTDTPMTAALKAKGVKLAPVEQVAEAIVRGADHGRPVVYAPAKWWLIMQVIRHMPRFIFDRLDI